MWQDFKAFILRGNVLDLAVAVVIGAAFGAVVNVLVDERDSHRGDSLSQLHVAARGRGGHERAAMRSRAGC